MLVCMVVMFRLQQKYAAAADSIQQEGAWAFCYTRMDDKAALLDLFQLREAVFSAKVLEELASCYNEHPYAYAEFGSLSDFLAQCKPEAYQIDRPK